MFTNSKVINFKGSIVVLKSIYIISHSGISYLILWMVFSKKVYTFSRHFDLFLVLNSVKLFSLLRDIFSRIVYIWSTGLVTCLRDILGMRVSTNFVGISGVLPGSIRPHDFFFFFWPSTKNHFCETGAHFSDHGVYKRVGERRRMRGAKKTSAR